MKHKKFATCMLALLAGAFAAGCGAQSDKAELPPASVQNFPEEPPEEGTTEVHEEPATEASEETAPAAPALPEEPTAIEQEEPKPAETLTTPEPTAPVQTVPVKDMALYLRVTGDGVNLRSGAGTEYAVLGRAEKNTLLAFTGEKDGWYKTYCRGKTAYISKKYAALYETEKADEDTENVISEGMKLLGVPYVYGAVRLHDGNGNLLKGFTKEKFDCSSLMQYIFYYGKGALLSLTTRTQVAQGKAVSESKLQRGDLLFFTNASRVNNVGIERVGHVALYLGDGYILHTASDYAKVEPLTSARRNYFICARRI